MKIIFLNSHPISYFSDMYRYLRSNGLNFEVWYCSKYGLNNHFDIQFNSFRKTEGLLEGFKSKFLLNFLKAKNAKETIFNTLNPSILKEISNLDRNTIVISHGWSRLTMVLTLIFGGMFGVKVGLRTETPLTHEYNYKGVKKSLRTFILKNLFKRVDYFFYIGTSNKNFYKSMGIKDDQLIFMPYSTKPSGLGYSSKKRQGKILFCGKLIEKKRPQDLLIAFHRLKNKNLELIYAGSGKMENELKMKSQDLGLKKQVLFKGLLDKNKLDELYKDVDLIVLPSGFGETWGLVINEAIEYGLPVIVSDMVGCSIDLCNNNGYIFKYKDITDLTSKLKKIYSLDDKSYDKLVRNSYIIKNKFSFNTINLNLSRFIKETN